MDLTIQILTKNNQNTLATTLQSVKPLEAKIIVVDQGSKDETINIAQDFGAYVLRLPHIQDNSEARNMAALKSTTHWQLYLHPGEILVQGIEQLMEINDTSYLTVIRENTITKEVRVWDKKLKFKNPIFEHLQGTTNTELSTVIYSIGSSLDYNEILNKIEQWKSNNVTAKEPYYFQAMTLLANQKYDEFLSVSEHYMFIEPNQNSISNTMNRYYYALVQVMHKKKLTPALQNINLCLCSNPLMAEFWCLIGDAYYHLVKNFSKAKDFYEIAIILGSRRLANDRWPMDISKYKEYPCQMIESCTKILSSKSLFVSDQNTL